MTKQFEKDGKTKIEKKKINHFKLNGERNDKALLNENDNNTAETITKNLEVDNNNNRNT